MTLNRLLGMVYTLINKETVTAGKFAKIQRAFVVMEQVPERMNSIRHSSCSR